MPKMRTITAAIAALACTALTLAGCGSGGSGGGKPTSGPIKIWYSNNAQEVAWGKATVSPGTRRIRTSRSAGRRSPPAAV